MTKSVEQEFVLLLTYLKNNSTIKLTALAADLQKRLSEKGKYKLHSNYFSAYINGNDSKKKNIPIHIIEKLVPIIKNTYNLNVIGEAVSVKSTIYKKEDVEVKKTNYTEEIYQALLSAKEEVYILVNEIPGINNFLEIFFKLSLTVYVLLSKGIKVNILHYTYSNTRKKLRILYGMGCNIIEKRQEIIDIEDSYDMVFIDPRINGKMISRNIFVSDEEGESMEYHFIKDSRLIKIVFDYYFNGISFDKDEPYIPSIIRDNIDSHIQNFSSKIKFYQNNNISFDKTIINRDNLIDIIPRQETVVTYKIAQLKYFNDNSTINIFESPLLIKLRDNRLLPINPPYLELKSDGRYHIVEGHSRFFIMYNDDTINQITVVVVKGEKRDMNRSEAQWENIREFDEHAERANVELSRNIESIDKGTRTNTYNMWYDYKFDNL